MATARRGAAPRLVHLTTTDMSLDWLLGPQLRAFAAAGYEVIGVSAPGPHVASLEAAGIRHVPLHHATRAVAPTHDAAAVVELVRVLRRLRPTIVHTHNPKPGVYGRIAGRLARVPIVVNTQHGLYATEQDRLARRVAVYGIERLAVTCSDAELVQNVEDLERLASLGVPRRRLVLLGNGIDLGRFSPAGRIDGTRAAVRAELGVGEDDVVVGLVGRMVAEKGYREVFAAAATLARTAPEARLVVVGPADPDKEDAVGPTEIAGAVDGGNVVALGRRDDVERLYAAMDCYVLASYREGFPRSAMEAAASGLPVIATDIRGCRQVVDPGTTGLLVPARDPVALAEAIRTLVRQPDLRRRMGDAAAAKAVAEFDMDRIVDTTLQTYARLGRAAGLDLPDGGGRAGDLPG